MSMPFAIDSTVLERVGSERARFSEDTNGSSIPFDCVCRTMVRRRPLNPICVLVDDFLAAPKLSSSSLLQRFQASAKLNQGTGPSTFQIATIGAEGRSTP